MALIEY